MVSSAGSCTTKAMRCTTWPRYRIFPSRAPVRRRRTARVTAMATWPRPSPRMRTGHGRRRAGRALPRAARRTVSGRGGRAGRAGGGHEAHARHCPGVRDAAGSVRKPAPGAAGSALRGDRIERLQRQPVHRLAKRAGQPGLAEAPYRRTALRARLAPAFFEATLAPSRSPPDRQPLGRTMHRADGHPRPLV